MAVKRLIVTRGELSNFIDLGLTTIASLIARGVFAPRKDNKFDLQETVAKIIKWQSNRIGNRGAEDTGDGKGSPLTQARIAHTQATTENVAFKTALARGEVVMVEAINDVIDARDNAIREGVFAFHSIAAQLVGLAALEIEDKLIQKSTEVLDALSNPTTIAWARASEAMEASAEAGDQELSEAAGAGPDRVGRRVQVHSGGKKRRSG